ncbi:MAG: hypothetical protein ABIJ40_18290 [Bacteroidota bacterium]
MSADDFSEYRELILDALKRIESNLKEYQTITDKRLTAGEIDRAIIKTKIAMWSAISGLITGGIVSAIIKFLF